MDVAKKLMSYVNASFYQSENPKELSVAQHFLCGGLTGVANATIMAPAEHIRTQMQMGRKGNRLFPHHNSGAECASFISKEYGKSMLYRGFKATLMRDIAALSICFGVFELLKRATLSEDDGKIRLAKIFACGSISGIFTWVFAYPLDLIKSKIQGDSLCFPEYRGIVHTIKKVYIREGGMAGFYAGLTPCVMRAVPCFGAVFATYELLTIFVNSNLASAL